MQFQNLQVHWETLPHYSDVAFRPIEKKYLKVLYITWSILYALVLAADITVILLVENIDRLVWLLLSIAIILLLIVAGFFVGTRSFHRKAYAVREKDILFRTGWIFQKLHIIPFNRIQHCVVQSGPIERKYGLASVSIYTAASNVQDITIRGLQQADAESLKSYILQQIQPLY